MAGIERLIAASGGWSPDLGSQLGQGMKIMSGMEQLKNAPIEREMSQTRLAAMKQDMEQGKTRAQREQEIFQVGDLAQDAIKIRPLLESGDMSRANVMLAERIKKIQDRGGDATDTMAFRDALNSGQITPQQASQELAQEIEALSGLVQ